MVPVISTVALTKTYRSGEFAVPALADVDVEITAGELVSVTGPSGSGKSTFLHLLGLLDRPSGGRYALEGYEVQGLAPRELARVRRERLGFVFQSFNLLARTSALENVELPLLYAGVGVKERRRRAIAALAAVHLEQRLHHRPNELSGGEQQRVAIARALVNHPAVLLADEPTGNLDTRTSATVLELLRRFNQEQGLTIVLVTHDAQIAAFTPRQLQFRDGALIADTRQFTQKQEVPV
ncbi:MAG: ABC transporter ATP-binding protein [Chloroflexi bacterium]|nr:ABC transporter ATP-binding protein [Chloroflexota bacterium]